jgi:hypothetical protein
MAGIDTMVSQVPQVRWIDELLRLPSESEQEGRIHSNDAVPLGPTGTKREVIFFGLLQTFLNLLVIALASASVVAFETGNTALGLGALGPAIGGFVGLTGLQWRITKRCIGVSRKGT